jgi:hypothetical protein
MTLPVPEEPREEIAKLVTRVKPSLMNKVKKVQVHIDNQRK